MSTPTSSRPSSFSIQAGAVVALIGLLCGSCASGGGLGDPRQCVLSVDNTWSSVGWSVVLNEPRRCPYSVKFPGDSLPYQIKVRAPLRPNLTNSLGLSGRFSIVDRNGAAASAVETQYFTQIPFNLDSGQYVFIGKFRGGTFGPGGALPQDSGTMRLFASAPTSVGAIRLTGNADSAKVKAILGVGTIPLGQASTWYVYTVLDTISYMYQWRLGGQAVTGAVGADFTKSFTTPGTYVISAITTRSDYSGVSPKTS